MITEIDQVLDKHLSWLRGKTRTRQVGEWVEITTPYLDRHNDYIQIYAKKSENGFLLSDAGYVISDLEQSGCKLDSPKRQKLLNITLNGFGVKISDGTLETTGSRDNFSLQKHNLVQAILAVNDLYYLAEATISSLFYEDVVAWLKEIKVRYTPNLKFTGKSGFPHQFDFVIPSSDKKPERIIRAVNHPTRLSAENMAFAWIDTKQDRPEESKAIAILNDYDRKIPKSVIEAFKNYDVSPVPWSRRADIQHELTL